LAVTRKQEMHNTRGKSKKRAEEKEIEEGGQEQEIELVTDSEMEQLTSDKEETEIVMDPETEIIEEDAQGDQPDKAVAREEPNWQDMMKFMAEQFKEQNKQSSCLSRQ
jgi:hypothetical protein